MSRTLHAVAVVLAAALCAPVSAHALSFTGTLAVDPVPSTVGPSVTVTATATATITESGCDPNSVVPGQYVYCGYFPFLTTVDGAGPCSTTGDGVGWVGWTYDTYSGPGTKSLSPYWPEYPVLKSGPRTACLYVSTGLGDDVLVASAGYNVPAPAPAPAPAPVAGTSAPVPTSAPAAPAPPPSPTGSDDLDYFMSQHQAKGYVRRIIRKHTSHNPRHLAYRCTRTRLDAFTCRPSWYDSVRAYSGTLTMTDEGDAISYRFVGLRATHRCMDRTNGNVRRCARRVRW